MVFFKAGGDAYSFWQHSKMNGDYICHFFHFSFSQFLFSSMLRNFCPVTGVTRMTAEFQYAVHTSCKTTAITKDLKHLCFYISGGYEPPLTNVFTMQWFLTLFATCLPNHTVLKIWDSVFFEGSEIILRVALAIWAKLGE